MKCAVTKVTRQNNQVQVTDSQKQTKLFDKIIFACHADTALEILKEDISKDEKDFLSSFQYNVNTAYLHQDENLMPKIHSIWASWNYLLKDGIEKTPLTTLSYWMNNLQPFIPKDFPLFVTLNPAAPPSKEKTLKKILYEHPIYNPKVVLAQQKLRANQGKLNTFFCGAHCGFGFHEDGLVSSLEIVEALGVQLPWKFDKSRYHTAPMKKYLSHFYFKIILFSFIITILSILVPILFLKKN